MTYVCWEPQIVAKLPYMCLGYTKNLLFQICCSVVFPASALARSENACLGDLFSEFGTYSAVVRLGVAFCILTFMRF